MDYTLAYIIKSTARVTANSLKRRNKTLTKSDFRKLVLSHMNSDANYANGNFYAGTRQQLRAQWVALSPADKKRLIAQNT
jgi:hypothetical protein